MGVSPIEEHPCKLLGKGNTDHIPLKTGLNCFFQWVGIEFLSKTGLQFKTAKNNLFKQDIELEPNQTV